MAMAKVSVLTLCDAIIPLKPSFDEESVPTVKVEHKWTSNNADSYYKMYLPVCSDPSQKELFLYVIDQFMDVVHEDRLHLSNGASRFGVQRIRLRLMQLSNPLMPRV